MRNIVTLENRQWSVEEVMAVQSVYTNEHSHLTYLITQDKQLVIVTLQSDGSYQVEQEMDLSEDIPVSE